MSLLLQLFSVILFSHIPFTFSQPTVITRSGSLIGTKVHFRETTLSAFLGIPYAEPPIGELRFKRTVPVQPWSERLAVEMPPACHQYMERYYVWNDYEPGQSEDCLYLNIWVPPNTTPHSKKAVMFWIHGGGFFGGSSRLPLYDGKALAVEGDVIVISINYRLGALGFFFSQNGDAPGNAGFSDMVEALKWAKRNIEFFGGDKDNITIFGDSAGGIAVSTLCVSPTSRGLFKRVIIQSGSATMYLANLNWAASRNVSEIVGCADANHTLKDHPETVMMCMRSTHAKDIMKAIAFENPPLDVWIPQYGDDILPMEPRKAIVAGQFECGDILTGYTADEGSIFLSLVDLEEFGELGYKENTVDKSYAINFLSQRLETFPGKEAYLDYFKTSVPANVNVDWREKLYQDWGDYFLLCPGVFVAEKSADKGNNVYFYIFAHTPSNSIFAPWTKAAHGEDIKFQFGMPLLYPQDYTVEEMRLSEQIIEIWSNFAKTGLPRKDWPLFSRENQEFIYLDIPMKFETGRGVSQEKCDILRRYFYEF